MNAIRCDIYIYPARRMHVCVTSLTVKADDHGLGRNLALWAKGSRFKFGWNGENHSFCARKIIGVGVGFGRNTWQLGS